jgi:hypothetical protein
VSGSGTIALQGATSIDGLVIFDSAAMINTGTVTQIGQLTVGESPRRRSGPVGMH